MFNALTSFYEDTILLVFRGHTLSVSLRSEQLRMVFEIEVKRAFDLKEKCKKGDLKTQEMEYVTKRTASEKKPNGMEGMRKFMG